MLSCAIKGRSSTKELRETITGGTCPNNTLLAYSQGPSAKTQMRTGAQGPVETQIKDSPITFGLRGSPPRSGTYYKMQATRD